MTGIVYAFASFEYHQNESRKPLANQQFQRLGEFSLWEMIGRELSAMPPRLREGGSDSG